MIRAMQPVERTIGPLAYCGGRGRLPDTGPERGDIPIAGAGGGGAADRFCAWAGRSGRRIVFSVVGLDPEALAVDLPLGSIVLAVRRGRPGGRKVLWAENLSDDAVRAAVRSAAAVLAAEGECELHLHAAAIDAAARRAIIADLAFPRLAGLEGGTGAASPRLVR